MLGFDRLLRRQHLAVDIDGRKAKKIKEKKNTFLIKISENKIL